MRVEWESETTKLVRYVDHAKGAKFPDCHRNALGFRSKAGRQIRRIVVHQSGGRHYDGREAVDRLAQWISRPPILENYAGRMVTVGGGLGYPGIPYTFVVPFRPDIEDGRSVVYRCWDDDWITWHTRNSNSDAVSVCFSGLFASRHAREPKLEPSPQGVAAGQDLILNYLMPRYGLASDDLCGHFDFGMPSCPGDSLEKWIRYRRGERLGWPSPDDELDERQLATREQRSEALSELGYARWLEGGAEGYRRAIYSLQADEGLVRDGVWGRQTERAVRRALRSLGEIVE